MSHKRIILVGVFLTVTIFIISILTYIFSLGPCPSGTFACDDGKVCVPFRSVCDKKSDCMDGQDEDPVECGNFHGSKKLLENLVQSLPSAENRSQYVCDLNIVPPGCICTFSTYLFCGNSQLSVVPTVDPAVTNLLIHDNRIKLHNDSFAGLELVQLNLKRNRLTQLPSDVFREQARMRRLTLNYNELKTLPPQLFYGMTSLEWLFLEDNRLVNINLVEFANLECLQWLNLSNNQLALRNEKFPALPKIWIIILDHNIIEQIDEDLFVELYNLDLLSLSFNKINWIHPDAFRSLGNLTELRISNNQLTTLSSLLFQSMPHLDALYLGNNKLPISNDWVQHLNISYFDLIGVQFDEIDFTAINNIHNLQFIVFNEFYYCSETPRVQKCRPNTDGVSSLEDLLTKPALRYSVWMMLTLTCLGNFLVLWGRFTYRDDENGAVSLVVKNLAFADILMGIYLAVIGTQDVKTRNNYQEIASVWVTSWTCAGAGILAMISSEVSMLIMTFISIERFLLIADPFKKTKRLNKQSVFVAMFGIWMLGTAIAVIPAILWRSSTKFYGKYSGTCFPLHLQELYHLGWQYSVFIFLVLNLTLLLLITMFYTLLFISIRKTRKNSSLVKNSTMVNFFEMEFAIRFFFLIFFSLFSWIPIILSKILSFFFLVKISEDFHAFLVVFVMPLNSAVNPLLYTFTTPKYRRRITFFRRGWQNLVFKKRSIKSSNSGGNGTRNTSNPDDSHGKIIPLLKTVSGKYKM